MLFSSILKRLQSEVSKHVGDTSRGAVFEVLVDEASFMSLDVLLLIISCSKLFQSMTMVVLGKKEYL